MIFLCRISLIYRLSDSGSLFYFKFIYNMNWKALINEQLDYVRNKINSDSCEVDVNTAMQIMSVIAHEPMSKAEAYQELGISRSKFDSLVKDGKLPQGRKRLGFNELVWYKDEILTQYGEQFSQNS